MKKAELVFIPSPGIGHLVPMAEFATRLLDRDQRLSITILLIIPPLLPTLDPSDSRIRYITIPQIEESSLLFKPNKSPENSLSVFIESRKPHVKDAITDNVMSDTAPLAGLVVDLFCTSMIDVAHQLGVPSYLFFTSAAAFLGLMLYLPIRHGQIGTEFNSSDPDSIVPSYASPVPASVIPSVLMNKDGGYASFLYHAMKFKETKGMIVNTFSELESHAINSIVVPPAVYAVGPILNLKGLKLSASVSDHDEIMKWLDDQPLSSVVFLCFGSFVSFGAAQLGQIAIALERSGRRFLWSVRQRAQPKDEYEMGNILPEGFLKRIRKRGMVCGWAPQAEVLAHEAVGGFVSHCGWNSILESLWNGVPIVTWPVYAEQQINAFEMVRELGLAVELKLDYRNDGGEVTADEIEKAITSAMDEENPVRERMKEMSEKSRKAVMEGGSSFASLGLLIEEMLGN